MSTSASVLSVCGHVFTCEPMLQKRLQNALEEAPKWEAVIAFERRGCEAKVVILMLLLCLSFTSVDHLKE